MDGGASLGGGLDGDSGAGTVEFLETCARVGEADPFASRGLGLGLGRDADAVIANGEDEAIIEAERFKHEQAWGKARFDAVADGVFGDGLEDHGGHEQIQGLGLDMVFDGEPAAEAHSFDVEVEIQQLQFAADGDLLFLGFEGGAEEVAEVRDHVIGAVRIFVDERGDGVERVEKEVRLELEA